MRRSEVVMSRNSGCGTRQNSGMTFIAYRPVKTEEKIKIPKKH